MAVTTPNNPILDSLRVIVNNTKATKEATLQGHQATVAAIHATANGGGGQQAQQAGQVLNAAGDNLLLGYTMSPPGSTPGGGAPGGGGGGATGGTPGTPGAAAGAPGGFGYNQPPPGYAPPPYYPPYSPPPGGGGGGGGWGGGGGPVGPNGPPGGGIGGAPGPAPGSGGVPYGPPPGTPGGVPTGQPSGTGTSPVGGGIFRNILGVANIIAEANRFLTDKSERAARYQGMEGGTTRKQGALEFGRELSYAGLQVLRNPLIGLTMQEGQQAFADVTSAGYRDKADSSGVNREKILKLFEENKIYRGMDGGESLSMLNAIVANGAVDSAEGLRQVSSALHEVSTAAGAAGVNALVARENFMVMFQGLTGSGAGMGATALAASGSAALAQYGRSMQNISTAPQHQRDFQYRAAAAAGMSVGEYQNLMRTDPAAVQGIVDRMSAGYIEQMVGPDGVRWIRDRANSVYGGKAGLQKDPEKIQRLADDWQSAFKPDLGMMVDVIANTTGVTVGMDQVTKWVVGQVMGLNASDQMVRASRAAGGGTGTTGVNGLTAANDSFRPTGTSQSTAAAAGTSRTPLTTQALRTAPTGSQVLVQTAQGPVTTSAADALAKYPNQVASGDVSMLGSGAPTGGSAPSTWDSSTQPQTQINGTVTVEATPELQKYLRFVITPTASAGDAVTGSRPDPSLAMDPSRRAAEV